MACSPEKPLLEVKGLCKYFPIRGKGLFRRVVGAVKAVDGVDFVLRANETLGLVGESGCGKTTTARTILRAMTPTRGSVVFRGAGRDVDLATLPESGLRPLRRHMQMIFQDPFSSLNPRMTVRQIVAEPLEVHRLCRGAELADRVAEILRKVGLKPEHQSRYPHAFSGGQRQRIGIARALVLKPALVVADESVSALDVSVQAQVINLLDDLKRDLGLSYIFVAHDLSVVRHICDRVAVMYAGRIVELAATRELFRVARHPYTRMLLGSVPDPDPEKRMRFASTGEAADVGNLPGGCSFHPRCREVQRECRRTAPALREVAPGHWVACCADLAD